MDESSPSQQASAQSAQSAQLNRIAPLSMTEVAQIASDLQALVGAQLQECLQTPSELGLAFYHERETLWLWIDLHPQRPLIVRVPGRAPGRKKITRPLTLFLRSRITGRRLASVRADLDRGRILIFSFYRAAGEEEKGPCEIEVRLFPHGQNVIVRDGAKSIAENKPKELPPSTWSAAAESARPWSEIEAQWNSLQGQKPKGVAAAPSEAANLEREWKRAIEKKTKALERMHEELEKKTSSVHSEVGEWLKQNGALMPLSEAIKAMPTEWQEHVDLEKSLSWNIEQCFHRAKENARKAEGTRTRLELVEKELLEMKAKGPGAFAKQKDREEKAEGENLLARADAKGRRLRVANDLEVYIGKSAADNLAILRRAQPFDYWLHLRDLPGSHAIMRRTRGRMVSDAEFAEAGRWVVEQSVAKRAHELKGERFDLLIVECRFVRPIKGDRLGRVNYTNDRVMSLKF